MAWTLEYDGTEQTLADWGITDALPFEFASRGRSAVDIITVDGFDDPFQWAYDSRVVIRRDRAGSGTSWSGGKTWFIGYVAEPRRLAAGPRQNHRYTLFDWWWLAERTPLRRIRKSYTGSTTVFATVPPSEVVLFEDQNENPIDTQVQFAELIALLNECWNPTRRGATSGQDPALDVVIDGIIQTSLQVPRYPVRDVMVSEAIQTVLAWTQDAVLETDYDSNVPIVHVRRVPFMPTETVHFNTERITSLNLKPRHDLVIPGVILYYKKIHSQDGVPGLMYVQDKYPAELSDWHPNPRIHTIEMIGSVQTTVRQKLVSSAVLAKHATEATRLGWWRNRFPWLKNPDVSDLAIDPDTVTVKDENDAPVDLVDYPYEILDGAVADWMESEYDVGFKAVTITALADFTINGATGTISQKPKQRELNFRCKLVDYDTGGEEFEFAAVAFFDPGETIFLGLAEQIWETHQQLQHEGVVSLVGEEIPDNFHLGILLDIITPGGSYQHNLVQRISGELTRGVMDLQIGPPGHLGIADMIELMRVNRFRLVYNLPSRANNPLAAGSSDITLSKSGAKENSTQGAGRMERDAAEFDFEE